MPRLCNHCECLRINGMRCHENGCPNQHEQIRLVDDGTLDTVFQCHECNEEMRFNFDPTSCAECDDITDECNHYDDFVYDCLRECADNHVCHSEAEWDDYIEEDEFNWA